MADEKVIHTSDYYCTSKQVQEWLGCSKRKAEYVITDLRNELFEQKLLLPSFPKGKVPAPYAKKRLMIE